MLWILGLIGLIVGASVWGGEGAVVGAAVGAALGWVLRENAQQDALPVRKGEAPSLAQRVSALEREVAELKRALGAAGAGYANGAVDSETSDYSETVRSEVPERPPVIPVPASHSGVAATAVSAVPIPVAAAPGSAPAPMSRTQVVGHQDVPEIVPVSAASPRPASSSDMPSVVASDIDFAKHLFREALDWLLGGNSVARVGILILFFGVAFLLKYAADNSILPVEFRLAGVCLGAVGLLALGWRLRTRRPGYALAVQGAGVGVLYLTVFAAARLYDLLPAGAAFALMVLVCGLAAGLAILQNASVLAVTGSAGGFLAPVLISTGGGSHVMLFSYYALLNAGIFVIAWFRAWRVLNLLGFVFTFGIATLWGVLSYKPALLSTTEPFLILFFLLYTGIALLYALRRSVQLTGYVDGTLIFGTPLAVAGLQAALMRGTPFGMAWSAVVMAAFYFALAAGLLRHRQRLGLLFDALLALGVIFATLAIPLGFDGRTTCAVWALEGAGVVWIAMRQQRRLPLWCGLLLQFAAGFAFLAGALGDTEPGAWPVFNARYIGTMLLALAGFFSAWCLLAREQVRTWVPFVQEWGLMVALWGVWWWLGGGVFEIWHWHVEQGWSVQDLLRGWLLFAVLSAWLAHLGSRAADWPLAGFPALGLTPVLALLGIASCAVWTGPPLGGSGLLAWPLAFVASWWLLKRQEAAHADTWLAPLHTLLFLTLCVLLSDEGYWRLRAFVPEGAWSWAAWAFGHGCLLAVLAGAGLRLHWPVRRFARAYLLWAALPLAALLWIWSLASLVSDGAADPLPFVPFLNPLDVGQMLVIVALVLWRRRVLALELASQPRGLEYAALGTVFLWLNAVLLRTLHHHFGVRYAVPEILESLNLQLVFLAGWGAIVLAALWRVREPAVVRVAAFASAPLVLVMLLWSLYANLTQPGTLLGRIPLLNPLDLIMLLTFGAAVLWWLRAPVAGLPVDLHTRAAGALGAGIVLIWLNAVLLRTLHHWQGVPYTLHDLAGSTLVQASLSVFWTVLALLAMLVATRRAVRSLWLVGGGLLAVTVMKMFLVDLSFLSGVARIVSFIAVGGLLLLIGYLSPMPPAAKEGV
ncbi:putative membrane protein [Cupriavidus metallidurans]|jgi:uncharacterized membrane protein|nr:DUF2339 domain-containing protein [Cupriavidus metallidurans]MDE4917892.1 DUF2339 domain-containing protein [Cupriavidus metallidurans]